MRSTEKHAVHVLGSTRLLMRHSYEPQGTLRLSRWWAQSLGRVLLINSVCPHDEISNLNFTPKDLSLASWDLRFWQHNRAHSNFCRRIGQDKNRVSLGKGLTYGQEFVLERHNSRRSLCTVIYNKIDELQ